MSDVLFEVKGQLGLITLNRPQAMNALNLGMVQAMYKQLKAWANDTAVQAVAVIGAGDKAFCAGGDVVSLYKSGKAWKENGCEGEAEWRTFFHDEYRLNSLIKHYEKPYIAIMNGITMGGGVGISVHGAYRIATDNTMLAMPETGLGLIPDVGGGFFLPRAPQHLGMYLALKGERVRAADCRYLGICNSYVPEDKIQGLLQELIETPSLDRDRVSLLLARYNEDAGESPLSLMHDKIDQYFGHGSVKTILDKLKANGGEWALEQLKALKRMSPISMLVTFEQMQRGAELDFNDVMKMEYRIVNQIMKGDDFYEGVRAILLDKDYKPKWSPATYKEIDDALVAAHFEEPECGDLTFED